MQQHKTTFHAKRSVFCFKNNYL